MAILVTGATGNVGRLVIDQLLARGVEARSIVAGARVPARAAGLADLGVQVRRLDYDDPLTIRDALEGIDRVMLVSASDMGKKTVQHRNVVAAAVDAAVERFVYTSILRATENPLVLAEDHVATEQAIAASGLPAVILRNDWYTENYAGDLAQASATGTLTAAAGTGRVASASRIDYAEAAAIVLLDDGHAGRTYELAGDVAWSYEDLAAAMTQVLDRAVEYRPLSAEERAAELAAEGLDANTVAFLTGLESGIAAGALDSNDRALTRLIGRPTTPLADGLRASMTV